MNMHKVIKEFGMTNLLLENDLHKIELQFDVNLGKKQQEPLDKDAHYYPQFSLSIRKEAMEMSKYYEVFYCLERSIRELISSRLSEARGNNWWNVEDIIPALIKEKAEQRLKDEKELAITQRSDELLDYTDFGELAQIIEKNWSIFNDAFDNLKAVKRALFNLKALRGPIAHCCLLAPDEVDRLNLAVKDWFRTMGDTA